MNEFDDFSDLKSVMFHAVLNVSEFIFSMVFYSFVGNMNLGDDGI